MKILLPYLQQNSHYAELERKNFLNDVVTTGQSWFAKMIYKNFDDVTVKFVNNIKSKELRENPKISKEICNSIKKKANEINADVMLKATKVDGVFSEDPNINPKATFYNSLSFEEAISKNLKVMDTTALTLARDNGMKIKVFNFKKENALLDIVKGETIGTLLENG